MNNSQVAHAWANQTMESAKGSNFYFAGPRIYSYGRHFLAGMIHETEYGRIYQVNCNKYSNTTAKHLSLVRRAIPMIALGPFEVPFPDRICRENLAYIHECLSESTNKARRARSFRNKANHMEYSIVYHAQYECYRPLLGIEEALPIPYTSEEVSIALNGIRDEDEKARQKRIEKEKVALELWEAGETVRNSLYNCPVRLRFKGNYIETSHGARVNWIEGTCLANKVLRGDDVVGYNVDGFTVTAQSEKEIVIGCHHIPYEAVDKLINPKKYEKKG